MRVKVAQILGEPPLDGSLGEQSTGFKGIETSEGWLIIYHGVRVTGAGVIYRVGIALLDLEDPRRIIRRGDEWVMSPREPYEIIGDVGYVVFPCGQVVDELTGLYYGAADSSIAMARGNTSEMLDWLLKK